MAKTLEKVLKTDMSRLPLRKAAEQLRKKGRGRDTMLAHITPREAARLKAEGGSGTINPDTGLPEFDDGFDFGGMDFNLPADTSTGIQAGIDASAQPSPYGGLDTTPFDQSLTQPSRASYDMALGNYFQLPSQTYAGIEAGIPMEAAPGGGADRNFMAYAGPQTGVAGGGQDAINRLASGEYQLTPEQQKEIASDLENQPIDLNTKVPSTGGFQTPFGTLNTKDLIAALGIGGLGLNYLNAQSQGKKAAGQLQGAYDQAAQQQMQLAQPYMQQGGTQLSQALTGALSPVQQQQLAAGQAAAAQATASSGGVAAAQAGRSVEDLRQRLLTQQADLGVKLLGAGTPYIAQAVRDQLSGTVQGINTSTAMSQQAGQAASGMLAMLGAMYARG
jgi:hypothetical protein